MTEGFENLGVLLVGPVPPPHGGMANQTLQLASLLHREGARVELIEVNAPYRPRWVARVRAVRAMARLMPFLWRVWRAAGRADVVHVMANSGWIWHLAVAPTVWIAALRRVPVVVNYRGGGASAFFRTSIQWVRPTLNRCQAIVVPSAFLERVFGEYGFAVVVVPNIVDVARFTPASGSEPGDVRSGARPHVLVARNLEPIYDIETALRTFGLIRERFPAARLTVAGSGVSRESLEALAAELGIQDSVVFTGRLDNQAIAALYRQADVVLNPSLVDNMPISILEALASGVPVVSTNVGGIPDVVLDGVTAALVPPGDPAAMSRSVLELLSNPDRREKQIRAGLEHVRRFTWERVRLELLEVYRRVTTGPPPVPRPEAPRGA